MSATHTPGPWEARFSEAGGYDCMSSSWYVGGGDGMGPLVATLDLASYGQRGWQTELSSDPRATADAHLIAAAPDLLEALKYLLELGGDDDRRIAAEAAIRKAEGQP